jgi:acetyl esterase/lipase
VPLCLALLARDRGGPKTFAQCLIYPMLDDRMITVSSKQFMDDGTWSGRNNIYAWNALLSGRQGGTDVSIYTVPSRATDLPALPQTWIDVGGAELFRDENIIYASKLSEFGIPVELHVVSEWRSYFPRADVSGVLCFSNSLFKQKLTPEFYSG